MRLLLVTPMPPDRFGAGAIPALLHAQLTALRERHTVTLITVAGPDPTEIEAVERLADEGVDIRPVVRRLEGGTLGWSRRRRIVASWLFRDVPLRTAWFAEPLVQHAIDTALAGTWYDIALVEDNAMALFRLPSTLPAVLTEYEVRKSRPIAPPPPTPARWPAWAFREADWRRWPRYQRRSWSRFDLLQVLTERDAAAVISLAPALVSRIRVNPFPIELPPRAHDNGEADVLVFAGNYSHPPNVDAAVWLARDIFPRVRVARPAARLVLAGPDPTPDVLGLADEQISVLGRVPDLGPVLARAAVVCAPVRTGGGMRMKVLHAMAVGRAVVTTSRGAAGFGFGEVEPPLEVADDPAAFASALVRLLEDDDARSRLGASARAYVEQHHSPEAYAVRVDAVLHEAIAARRTRREG